MIFALRYVVSTGGARVTGEPRVLLIRVRYALRPEDVRDRMWRALASGVHGIGSGDLAALEHGEVRETVLERLYDAATLERALVGTAETAVTHDREDLPGARRRRLLVVDDSPDVADVFRVMFDPGRYHITWAPDAEGARRVLASDTPLDLIVLDVCLPGTSGIDLCREIKAAWPRLPVLVMTGRAEHDTAARARSAGADLFMRKPFAIAEIEAAARRFLPPERARLN